MCRFALILLICLGIAFLIEDIRSVFPEFHDSAIVKGLGKVFFMESSRTKIIAFTNRKGGVGKSTMSVHTAAGLAARGLRVGLIDTDSQGHVALMLGLPEENGLYDAMIDKKPLDQAVRLVPPEVYTPADRLSQGSLFVLPSSDRTYRIPYMLNPNEMLLFLEMLDQMAEWLQLDVIIIDTNPTLNLFDGVVYLAVDGFVYVTECERLALDGVVSALNQLQNFANQRKRYLNRPSCVLGVLPNKMRADTRLHRHNISKMSDHFGVDFVWNPVILRTVWAEAVNSRELVYTYAPDGYEAKDAWQIVQRIQTALGNFDGAIARSEEVLKKWQLANES